MSSPDFSAKLAEIRFAMEGEEWAKAIALVDGMGAVPDKLLPVIANIFFYLLVSRNEHARLAAGAQKFEATKSKDCVTALLLLRDQELGYAVHLPADWTIEKWEAAVEAHTRAGGLQPKELPLCLHFLSFLNRPRLLELLSAQAVEAGGCLNNELVEVVLRCYLRAGLFAEARRFLWINNLNNIAFVRFEFLIDRAEKAARAIPHSDDKFLRFLRRKFGHEMPAELVTVPGRAD